MVTTSRAPRSSSISISARYRATPSSGSVPEAASSIRMMAGGGWWMVDGFPRSTIHNPPTTSFIHFNRLENVERSFSMDWSSPMSTARVPNTGRPLPSPAGMANPHWVRSTHRPRVFMATDFPPAFGPVMTNPRSSGSIVRSKGMMGTHPRTLPPCSACINTGLRAATSTIRSSVRRAAGMPSQPRLMPAMARRPSSSPSSAVLRSSGSRCSRITPVRMRSRRSISRISSASRVRRSLWMCRASAGSM